MNCLQYDNQYLVGRVRGLVNRLLESKFELDALSFFGSVLGELPVEISELRIQSIELCLTDITDSDPVISILRARGVDVLI